MIRHLPEGLVPFEDCGYAREPLHPLEGQVIRLGCLCDGAAPVLEMADGRKVPGGTGTQEHCYTWRIPAEMGTLRYRFVSGEESTPWFEAEILRPVSVSHPLRTGRGWAELYPGVYLCAEGEKCGAALALQNAPREAESPLHFDEDALWSLGTLSCTEITLFLRQDGTPARMETVLRGGQRHVYGTGERFDGPDQQGRGSCGQVVEHFTQQGPWSYLPVPMFLTDGGFGWFRDAGENVRFAFEEGGAVRIESAAGPEIADHLLLGTPAAQLRAYLNLTGECVLPPEWAFGLWISANGWHCDADVDEQLSMLEKQDCPASVMVLEAWSDESTFYRWNAVWPDPAETVRRIRDHGLHLVLWQIPVLKALNDCPDVEPVRRDWEEAIARGYVVRREDGSPYVIPDKWFAGSLLPDFTNPEACRWWFDKRQPLLEMGVEGFKTDGGEFLFGSDVRLADGTPGGEAHNRYPMQYEKAYHDWMRSSGVAGVAFSRAGYTGAQTVPIHWAGDQLSTWEELRGQLSAGLSAGLSGVLFWSFDIGGFAGEIPDRELYLRATAMGCFCPVMQWHAEPRNGQFFATGDAAWNNDRSPWNLAGRWNDPSIAEIACAFARLRERLRPMLYEEAQFCVQEGRPMMAHLCLAFPDDEQALECGDEYLLGRRLLVAPIVQPGVEGRKVYLPKGRWKHFFTGKVYEGGQTVELSCPLNEALVLEREEEGTWNCAI